MAKRFVVKTMRDDNRLLRQFGVIDTSNNSVVIHTNNRFNAETYADDLNEELKYSC